MQTDFPTYRLPAVTAPPRSGRRPRRGMTIIIVLGLISITLALSYAMMRSQSTSTQIQTNLNHRADARQAALTGLSIALRQMRMADWAGVDTTLTGSLGSQLSYSVKYVTGDPNLQPFDSDYAEYPYRVTVTSTGVVADAADPNRITTHTVQAVVQLLRQRLVTTPANWTALQQLDDATPYTVNQWSDEELPIQLPVQIKGPIRLQGQVKLCEDYPPHDNRAFNGSIDEVAMFSSELSSSELSAIYAAGIAGNNSMPALYIAKSPTHWWRLNDAAGSTTAVATFGGFDGVYAAATAGQTGANVGGGNLAAKFNGYNSHINLGNVDVSGNRMTILAWVKPESFDTQSDVRFISKAVGTEVQDHHWMLGTYRSGSSHLLRFRLRTGGYTSTLQAYTGHLTTGQWHLVAAVYDGITMKLYRNGSLVGWTLKTGNISTNSTVPAWLGDNPPGSILSRYLGDLNQAHLTGMEDNRPLTGPIYVPYSRTDESNRSLLTDVMGVETTDITAENTTPLNHPGQVKKYRLYPGGKEYDIEQLPDSLTGVTYEPTVLTNPLGLFRNAGNLTLNDNVTIRGTVLTSGSSADIYLAGENVKLLAADLPALYGDATVRQLPVTIVADDLRLLEDGEAEVQGMAISWDEFEIREGSTSASLAFQGRVLTKEMKLGGRWSWDVSASIWQLLYNQFIAQENAGGADSDPLFPHWIEDTYRVAAKPVLTISPESREVSYHWHNWNEPFFPADPTDGTIQWDLISWTEEN